MSKLNAKNYDDAVNEYYDLKQQYRVSKEKEMQTFLETNEKMSWREKRNLFKSLNYKCVNCRRYVGSIFKINIINEDRHLIAKCGDQSNPCPLNIDINMGTILSYEYSLQIDKEIILDHKKDIIKDKNNLMFGYISSKQAIDRFDKLKEEMVSSIDILESTNNKYLNITNNLEKKEKIIELQQQVYGIINTIKIYIKQYESSNNPALINDAVTLYTEELLGKITELNMLNFAYKAVEYNVDSNTYTLVKKQYSVEEMEINIGADDKVISFVTGISDAGDTGTATDKSVVKKKGRKTKAQLAEEEKVIDQLPDKFGPSVVPLKKTRTARKQTNPVKNKTIKKQRPAKKAVQFVVEEEDSVSEKSIEITIPNPKLKENATKVTEVKDIDWGTGSDESFEIEVKGKGLEEQDMKQIDLGEIDLGAIELSSHVSDIYEDDLDFQNDDLESEETEAEKMQDSPFE
jgi:hypothetical protein